MRVLSLAGMLVDEIRGNQVDGLAVECTLASPRGLVLVLRVPAAGDYRKCFHHGDSSCRLSLRPLDGHRVSEHFTMDYVSYPRDLYHCLNTSSISPNASRSFIGSKSRQSPFGQLPRLVRNYHCSVSSVLPRDCKSAPTITRRN